MKIIIFLHCTLLESNKQSNEKYKNSSRKLVTLKHKENTRDLKKSYIVANY